MSCADSHIVDSADLVRRSCAGSARHGKTHDGAAGAPTFGRAGCPMARSCRSARRADWHAPGLTEAPFLGGSYPQERETVAHGQSIEVFTGVSAAQEASAGQQTARTVRRCGHATRSRQCARTGDSGEEPVERSSGLLCASRGWWWRGHQPQPRRPPRAVASIADGAAPQSLRRQASLARAAEGSLEAAPPNASVDKRLTSSRRGSTPAAYETPERCSTTNGRL